MYPSKIAFLLILAAAATAMLLLFFEPEFVCAMVPPDGALRASLSSMLSDDTASLGGVAISIYFLTGLGQLDGSGRYLASELHGLNAALVVLSFLVASLIAGVAHLQLAQVDEQVRKCLFAFQEISAITSVLMVIPLSISRVEDLDPYIAARKLASKITPAKLREYGLVERSKEGFRLVTYGNNYNKSDPLAAFHEIVRMSVDSNDRLLLGRLVSILCERISRCYGIRRTRPIRAGGSEIGYRKSHMAQVDERDGMVCTLHIMHYVLRLANNLKDDWGEGTDLGRTSTQAQLVDLCTALCASDGTQRALTVVLCAIYRISMLYSDRTPTTRVEPLNGLITCSKSLEELGRDEDARLMAAVLGAIYARTIQLDEPRSGNIEESLGPLLARQFEKSVFSSWEEESWGPFRKEADPWSQMLETILH